MKNLRKRIWIDQFQTGLLVRIVMYCVVFQVTGWAISAFCDHIEYSITALGAETYVFSNALFRRVLVLVVLVPPLLFDVVRFAHRLVGPLYRFRKTIQAIAAGEPVGLVHLRKGDMLMDLKDDFNAMLRHLEEQGLVLVKAPEPRPEASKPQPALSQP